MLQILLKIDKEISKYVKARPSSLSNLTSYTVYCHDVQTKCSNLLIFYFGFSFYNRCYLLYLLASLQIIALVAFALVKVAVAVFPTCSKHCQDRI